MLGSHEVKIGSGERHLIKVMTPLRAPLKTAPKCWEPLCTACPEVVNTCAELAPEQSKCIVSIHVATCSHLKKVISPAPANRTSSRENDIEKPAALCQRELYRADHFIIQLNISGIPTGWCCSKCIKQDRDTGTVIFIIGLGQSIVL